MKQLNVNKLATACAAALLTGGMLVHVSPAIAATAAGTQIKNLATVTYQDTNGNTYSAQSNEAIITVKQVYSAEVGTDTTKTAAPGQVVYIQHTLTNTGNGEDSYTVKAGNDTTISDQFDSSSIKVYLDSNGNGLADPGEQEVTASTPLTLAAGESVPLVIAVNIPNNVSANDTIGVKLDVTAASGQTVTDTSTSKGTDTLDGTNQTLITVTSNAVLNFTKSAVLDAAKNQITYTLSVTNTGNTAAADVKLYDALPTGTTYVSSSASGLLTSNGDTLPASTTLSESTLGVDLNKDGDAVDSLPGISATDSSLAPGATTSVTFKVAYDPANFNNDTNPGSAGDIIKNISYIKADTDGNPGTPDETVPSNPTQTPLPQLYGVNTDDTGGGASSGTDVVNDGNDDTDDTDNKQVVDIAPAGSTVLFKVDVQNTGTGPDTFELAVNKGTFPTGTVFTLWTPDGTVQLVDTNSQGGVDTGVINAGATSTIMVKAQLPAGVTGSNFQADLVATSASDPSTTPTSDSTPLVLGSVSAPGADLYDNVAKKGTTANEDDLAHSPEYGLNNGANLGTRPVYDATVGSTVTIPLYIDNNSGAADSFQLSLGSSFNGTTVGALPTGWSVLFYKGDGAGKPTGSPITSTALLPAGSNGNEYIAVVTIASDPAYALADYVADNDGDGVDEQLDANGDGDGDQPIFIRIQSANTGAADTMLDAIDVEDFSKLTLTPPGNNQIQPGGSVDYTNTLENTGNTSETVELTATNSLDPKDWGNVVKVPVDTTGDGKPDVMKTLAELAPGDEIIGVDLNGNPVVIEVTDSDNDNNPEVTIEPGEKLDLTATTFAPSSAAPGETDILTISATNVDPNGPSTSVEDTSNVILGQVRLTKKVAYDHNCDGTPSAADGSAVPYETSLTQKVAPGECAVWQIVAENQGDADALNVVVRDKIPAFSTYKTGSLSYCLATGCMPATVSDTADGDAGKFVDPNITFYVGLGADPANDKGGKLVPGEQSTVRFVTKVN